MIHKYSCSNFYSIKDRIEVRFDVNENAPVSPVYVDDRGHGRISLVEAIIGPNAAGKTNVIKALAFIRHIITTPPTDKPLPFQAFAGNHRRLTESSVIFSVGDRLFEHSFRIRKNMIWTETIREKSLSGQRKTYKTIFRRSWDPNNGSYRVTRLGFRLPSGLYARRGASVVASAKLTGDADHIGSKIFDYWHDFVTSNVWESGNRDDGRLHSDFMTEKAIQLFYEDASLKSSIGDVLRRLDVGFVDFERQKLPIEDDYYYQILHRSDRDRQIRVPIQYESSGTKRTILLLMYITQILRQPGGIAAIDELDAYLHPDIVETLVKIFMDPQTNPNRAQLLFSSHSHQLLTEFDKQQITLVEKGDRGSTDVWRLDDVPGIRSDDNYYSKYIAGAYTAKPRIG